MEIPHYLHPLAQEEYTELKANPLLLNRDSYTPKLRQSIKS
jgi:hypothetical protein